MIFDYRTARENFLSAKIKGCKWFFETHNNKLEQAYCEMILDNLKKAKKIFESLGDKDIRAHWGRVMIEFIKGEVSLCPTYFELRNFLEIDLNIFIMYCKGDYVEKIVRYADFMYQVNPEVYKSIGRVFLNTGFKEYAMFFLERAKERFYQDPELHYILAQVYDEEQNYEKCKDALDTCLNILPEYAPAKALLKKIAQPN